jgi:hypothetical protein
MRGSQHFDFVTLVSSSPNTRTFKMVYESCEGYVIGLGFGRESTLGVWDGLSHYAPTPSITTIQQLVLLTPSALSLSTPLKNLSTLRYHLPLITMTFYCLATKLLVYC